MTAPDLQTTHNAGIDPSVFYFADAGRDSIGQSIGRGISAGRGYEACTRIFAKDRPLAAALNAQHRKECCASCYAWRDRASVTTGSTDDVKNLQQCANCRAFKYCNKRCQAEHWKRIHKFQCKPLKRIGEQFSPTAIEAALQVILQVTIEILTRRKHGTISDHQWDMLCSLPSHSDEVKRSAESEFESTMSGILAACHSFAELKSYRVDFIFEMYTRIRTNSLTLVTPAFDVTGIWIDEIISQINHSCDPNAYIVMDGPRLSLRALKPIEKDEQICISYIDTTDPCFRRQEQLKENWYFTCRCTKCEHGRTAIEDGWKIEPKDLSPEWKEKAAILLKKRFGDQINTTDISDEQRVAILQDRVFEMYKMRSESDIDEEMDFCAQTGLWPVYRQPYAAFRNDLIINLCGMGRHKEAWKHCGIRYWHILPILYPQKAHPTRVVQLFFTARLAVYLAEEGSDLGVNMLLIGLMLMRETKELVPLSHGEDNALTRAVQDEYNKIMPPGDVCSPRLEEQLQREKSKWQSIVGGA